MSKSSPTKPSKKKKTLPKGSLTFLVTDSFGISKTSEDFEHIYGYTVSYLSKGTSAFEYQDLIRPYCVGKDFSAKDFRLRLHNTQYLSLTLKLFLLSLGKTRSIEADDAMAVASSMGVYKCDARRLFAIWESYSPFRSRIKKMVREIPADKRDLLDDVELVHYFNQCYPDVYRYVKYITYKKLRFLAKSSNLELSDLHSELMSKVLQTFYMMVPMVLADAHVINYLKRSAHNQAINMIKMGTTQKRGRLINVDGDKTGSKGNSLLVVSENQMRLTADMQEVSYDELQIDGEKENSMQRFELEFSVAEILTKMQLRTKKYRVLKILMGTEDPEFTSWLQAKGLCSSSDDNVDVQNKRSVKEFNQFLSEFLHVSETKLNVFLFKLRKDLALDHSGSPTVPQPTQLRHG